MSSILLVSQYGYPLYPGGPTLFCDLLCRGLPQHRFEAFVITDRLDRRPTMELPENVTSTPVTMASSDVPEAPGRRGVSGSGLAEVLERLLMSASRPEDTSASALELFASYRSFSDSHDTWRSWETKEVDDRLTEIGGALWNEGVPLRHLELRALKPLLRFELAALETTLPACDILHCQSAGLAGVLGAICRSRGAGPALIVQEHGVNARERSLVATYQGATLAVRRFVSDWSRFKTQISYRFADRIVATSAFNGRWAARLGAEPSKIEVIHNGVATDAGTPANAAVRRSTPVIASAGVFWHLKDQLSLIRAAALVHRARPEARFRLHGDLRFDRSYVRRCRDLVRQLKLQRVVHMGPRARGRLFAGVGIHVQPSLSESLPFALLEAMALAIPVVATRVGGMPEVVDGVGSLVAPGDPEALATAILGLLEDRSRRLRQGELGRQRILKRFRSEQMVSAFERVYRAWA